MDQKLYDLMDWAEIEAIVYSEHDHPETVLGVHPMDKEVLVQAFLPGAKSMSLKNAQDGKLHPMEEADEEGFFAALLPQNKLSAYELVAEDGEGEEKVYQEPYQYPAFLEEKDLDLFEKGAHYEIYRYLGAHLASVEGCGKDAVLSWGQGEKEGNAVKGTHFAVWAPNAMRVSVVGDFNHWDGRRHPMYRLGDSGVFALFIPGVGSGELYKYEIKTKAREILLKTDPYGFQAEVRPDNASIVADLSYQWGDGKWLQKREKSHFEQEPISIYEVHLGSWKKAEDGEHFLNYREIAPKLAKYVKEMGYTHIELMPVMEHPLDETWGYQVTGYYAVTSRYGTPQDFMYFMDYMHQQGLGVILDWAPAYFPKAENGLARFDGTCLYEHLDPRQGVHPQWGTLLYNYGRPQVANFLIANAMFWKEVYHADGIRMDAVASMLRLDYGRGEGEWVPNERGGNENLHAIKMLRTLSIAFHEKADGALLIAEESDAWPLVTGSLEEDGLGFDLKWNTGWMQDILNYLRIDPYFRKGSHNALVFSMVYAYCEKFLLMFPHNEVANGKGSMLAKMPGDKEQKLGNLRAAFGYMMVHPGKKLHFMGQEFAQEEEWNGMAALPWERLEDGDHKKMQGYVRALNQFYAKHPALYEGDYDMEGFEWVSCLDADHSIITFMRKDLQKKEQLLVICNFTPVMYTNFEVGVPFAGTYQEIFNSDCEEYGGTGCLNQEALLSKEVSWDGKDDSIAVNVPPFGICIYEGTPKKGV